jgi:high affinity Mn2+ porin
VPAVAYVRTLNRKDGLGVSAEQSLSPDVGLFARASWADGKSETYSFTEIENSMSAGAVVKGTG